MGRAIPRPHPLVVAGSLLVAFTTAAPAAAQQQPQSFDPWEGIEPGGRIPKVEKPDDIEYPERWRYIPEGRLKPGDRFRRFLVSSFVAPFVFDDTDVGFGGGVTRTRRTRSGWRPRRRRPRDSW